MGKRWLVAAVLAGAAAAGGGAWLTQRGPLAAGSAQAAKTPD